MNGVVRALSRLQGVAIPMGPKSIHRGQGESDSQDRVRGAYQPGSVKQFDVLPFSLPFPLQVAKHLLWPTTAGQRQSFSPSPNPGLSHVWFQCRFRSCGVMYVGGSRDPNDNDHVIPITSYCGFFKLNSTYASKIFS